MIEGLGELTPAERADQFLLAHLNPFEAATFKSGGYIRITGSCGGSYCIHNYTESHNRVFGVFRDEHVTAYCTYSATNQTAEVQRLQDNQYLLAPMTLRRPALVPAGDEVLAHKLLIEADEQKYLALARHAPIVPCQRIPVERYDRRRTFDERGMQYIVMDEVRR